MTGEKEKKRLKNDCIKFSNPIVNDAEEGRGVTMKAIYARQSVDRMESISIESQIEFCKYELKGEDFRMYVDKGYSGKNTDRPNLQKMVSDIKKGEITHVIVYKLDRISRSILDFTSMMEFFQKYHVEFISATEKFDTSTPVGRAMLSICIVFAQLERETIQKRIADAYASRSKKGLYMGGRIPYGYRLVDTVIDGIKTSKYEIVPQEAEQVVLIYHMYAQPQFSYGDVVRYLQEKELTKRGEPWSRSKIATLIKNPIYVRSDWKIYEFFHSQGAILHNDPSEFIGIYGCYLYQGAYTERKTSTLRGQYVVLAPHEGFVEADIWLRARMKCLHNQQSQRPIKATNTWLAGKIKCGRCGYALIVKKSKTKREKYFVCSHKYQTYQCSGGGTIYADEMEDLVFQEMKRKLREFQALHGPSVEKDGQKVAELHIKRQQIKNEIYLLLEKVRLAGNALMPYLNQQIEVLSDEKKRIEAELKIYMEKEKNRNIPIINNYMDHLPELSFEDKRILVDIFVEKITAMEGHVCIWWKI